jgi:prepilin-type processing-associated H-X9-DG protein
MICKQCKRQWGEGIEFCPECGARVRLEQSRLAWASFWFPVFGVASIVVGAITGIGALSVALIGFPLGFIAAILGLIDVRMNRERKTGGPWAALGWAVAGMWIVPMILMMVMAPQAHEAARKASCQDNLKSIGSALLYYCEDYDDQLPSSYLFNHSKSWNKGDFVKFASMRGTLPSDAPDYVNDGTERKPKRPGGGKYQTWTKLLFPYLRYPDAIWCPGDHNDYHNSARATVSYFYKAAMDRAWYAGCKRGNDYLYPADQICFYEGRGWHDRRTRGDMRNGVHINCVYLDGHVRTVVIRNSTLHVKGNKKPSPLQNKGEPAWYNCNTETKTLSTGQHWDPAVWCDSLE